jgi:hypothetical protein
MPAITSTNIGGTGATTVTETTLDGATDSMVYLSGVNQTLTLRNPTAGALTPIIDGDGANAALPVAGAAPYDLSGGYPVGSIGVGEVVFIKTDTIKLYLEGTIAITGGTGIIATLTEG